MNIMKFGVDLIGTIIEIYATMLLYTVFWESKSINKLFYIIGISGVAILNTTVVYFLQNSYLVMILLVGSLFLLGFYYRTTIISQILVAIILGAIFMVSEIVVGLAIIQIFNISIETIQNNVTSYMFAVLTSKLLPLFVILVIQFGFSLRKHKISSGVNLSMLFLPLQSIILGIVVQNVAREVTDPAIIFLCNLAMALSVFLIFFMAYLMKNQIKAIEYKQENKTFQTLLKWQLKHYEELYNTQQEIRLIRHDMKNELMAVSGLLGDGNIKQATKRIEEVFLALQNTERIIYTEYPAVDAVLNIKIKEASQQGISINHKIILDSILLIDQVDLAMILAYAIDNAIEAIKKSSGVDTRIQLLVTSNSNYISIFVENYFSGTIDKQMRTSKDDKDNHGFGIPQMKRITEKYNGNLSINIDSNKFSLNILLENEK